AIKVFEEVEGRTGVTERTALLRYELWKKAGKDKKATQALQQLIKSFPKNVNYQHHLASHLNRLGKNAQAQEVYRSILTLDPDDARANVAMASTYRKQGDESGYLQSIKPIVRNPDTDIDLKIAELMPYVREVQRNPQDEKVVPLLELLADLEKAHPQDAKASSIHADVLNIAGRQTEALAKFKRTIELNPSNYLVWEQYLSTLAEQGMMSQLQTESEMALDFFPNQAFIYYCNGMSNAALAKYKDARSSLDQAILMAGKDNKMRVSIYAMQGHVFRNLALNDRAEKAFEDALAIDASDPGLLNDYAYHLARTGQKLDEALDLVKKAIDRDAQNPRYLGTKAWIHFKRGESEQASKVMDQAMKMGGDRYGYLQENYGDILFVSKDVEGAVERWKSAQELGIDSENLKRKIEERRLDDAQ
ncbi:MAG: tetratricopeptide repeat protein, partial [Saprospiraceae bacterium]|nr:tetratricopeptide repeat protein [Saprospiraceae bacterium]